MSGTATITVRRADLGLRRFGRVLRAVGLVGVVSGLLAVAAGLWLLRDLDVLFGRSVVVTAESLATVDASLDVATDSVELISAGLAQAEQTSRGLEDTLDEGADLLADTQELLRGDVAGSLESIQRSMPALIQVGGMIDATLRTLDDLPVGPTYNPDEPFDETLQALSDDLEDLPGDLRAQATTIGRASTNLRAVGADGRAIAASIAEVRGSLDAAGDVLSRYRTSANEARDLLDETTADLGRRLAVLRGLVVLLGVVYCTGQALPLYLGHRLATSEPAGDEPDVG